MSSSYNHLRLCSFKIKPEQNISVEYQTVKFPANWKKLLETLLPKSIKPQRLPIQSLNHILTAYVPGIVVISKYADSNLDQPWLYCCEKINSQQLVLLIQNWVFSAFPKATDEAKQKVIEQLKSADLVWETETLSFNDYTLEKNGTAKYQNEAFSLLPAYLVNCLTGQTLNIKTDFGEKKLIFYRAIKPDANGCELVSEPLEYIYTNPKTNTESKWFYSVVIKFTIQTLPWIDYPIINCDFSIRRWVTKSNSKLLKDKKISVYLKTDSPWNKENYSFLVAKLKLKAQQTDEQKKPNWVYEWVDALSNLIKETEFQELPNAQELVAEPLNFPQVFITFKNGMKPDHKIKLGFTPGDRQALLTAMSSKLPEFELVNLLDHVNYKFTDFVENPFFKLQEVTNNIKQYPQKITEKQKKINEINKKIETEPKEKQTKLKEQIEKLKKEIIKIEKEIPTLPHLKSQYLAEIKKLIAIRLNGRKIKFHIWYQETETKELIIKNIQDLVGDYCLISEHNLGDLGSPLDVAENKSDQIVKAVQKRAEAIENKLENTFEPAIAYIELQDKEHFELTYTDPKLALRWGHSRLGWKSQFIATDTKNNKKSKEHRVKSAVLDGLRQLLLIPFLYQQSDFQQLSLFSAHNSPQFILNKQKYFLPNDLNFIAFWMLRRNASGHKNLKNQTEYLPIFVRIPANFQSVEDVKVYTPIGENQKGEWLSYSDTLKALTTGEAKGYKDDKLAKSFVKLTIEQEILPLAYQENVVFFTYAQNSRKSWLWLQNGLILKDKISVDPDSTPYSMTKYPKLTIIRLRDKDNSETPEYWATNQDESKLGYTKGLFKLTEQIFYSSNQTPTTKKFNRHLSKLTKWEDKNKKHKPPAPDQDVIMPNLLEITVVSSQQETPSNIWAALTHELRYVCFNYDDALKFPLPLHIAKQIEEYSILLEYLDE